MSLAVKVEDLSKRYRLGVINRDTLYRGLKNWGPCSAAIGEPGL
jgi:hypothetical protein